MSAAFQGGEPGLVSIIIPTRNRFALLRETIHSVQAQSYETWEAIVVDDGSTDETIPYLTSLSKDDHRVRLVQHAGERSGPPVSRNIGLAVSRGEYVLFLDSDDLLAPSCLAGRVDLLRVDPTLQYAVGAGERFHKMPGDFRVPLGDGEERYDLARALCMQYPWQTSGPLWRRSIFAALGNWDESLRIGQDLDLAARALILGFKYRRLHSTDYYYRQGTGGVGANNGSVENQASHRRRIEHMRELLSERGLLVDRIKAMLAGNYLWVAQNLAAARQLSTAKETWRNASQHDLIPRACAIAGWLWIHAIAFSFGKLCAPLAALFLPRGLLIQPWGEDISPPFIGAGDDYRPMHLPHGAGGCLVGNSFSFRRWFTYPFRRMLTHFSRG